MRTLPLLLAGFAVLPSLSAAQTSNRSAQATRIQGGAPTINGRLDESVWLDAQVITDFIQRSPIEGVPPTEETLVYIMYDDEAIYIGARMLSRDPANIATPVTRRDGSSNAEQLTITLDTYLDRRTAFSFAITSGGVRSDYFHSSDSEHRRQSQYDPVWEAEAVVDSAGWTAEMKIPYSQIRYTNLEEQAWGMNIKRWTPALRETDYWVMVPTDETGYISRFGTLNGLVNLPVPRRLEVVPYVAGDATAADTDPNDPFSSVLGNRFGADAKVGVGPNLTLDLTVNPDFGQVEADPAEVNLTAFETFFDERRQFFIEGRDLLTGDGPDYFYSRRIGGRPHGGADGDFVDRPDNTTILGAAKMTGRLSSGLSVGGLFSVTSRERARTYDLAADQFGDVVIEPPSGFGVLRLQQEIGASQSTIGGTFTGVRRAFGGSSDLAELLHREAYAGGTDWRLRFKDGEYVISGHAGFSHVRGTSESLLRTQQSSAHYYQRPDASHIDVDSLRTSLSGYSVSVRADKNAGRRILWGAQISARSPGFEINDAGRLGSADAIDYNADVQIRETQPGTLFRSWQFGTSVRGGWNYGGDQQQLRLSQDMRFTFHNFWDFNIGVDRQFRAQNDGMTRGGPTMGTGSLWSVDARLNNSFSDASRWRINGRYENDELGGWNYNISGGLTLRPLPAFQFSIDPSYRRSVNARQYIGTEDNGPAITFNRRYVFGFIERSTISARFRMDYAFTPDFTIEGYAEPFASSGRYFNHGELAAPGSRELRTYGTDGTTITQAADGSYNVTEGANSFSIDNRDFNVLSFRSNLVARWEWRPGSTFFLVWQQSRSASHDRGDLVRFRSLRDAFRSSGDNFFAIKVTYWMSVN